MAFQMLVPRTRQPKTNSRPSILIRDESGSFTLEATMIFPLILLCISAVLFFSYTIFEKSVLASRAFEAAERTAYTWGDSHKDPITGAYFIAQTDWLYWRFSSDGLAGFLPGFGGNGGGSVSLLETEGGKTDLVRTKLKRIAPFLPSDVQGELRYRNLFIERAVDADLTKNTNRFSLLHLWNTKDASVAESQASSYVADHAEFLRLVDFTRSFVPQLKGRISPNRAAEILGKVQQGPVQEVNIRSERDAKEYLQNVIGGYSSKVQTKYGERQIDVLDPDGVMHEAKYTVNTGEAKDQIRKDVELIREGKVKGVVWHFFPVAKTGRIDLSPGLRKELENQGIVIIEHKGRG